MKKIIIWILVFVIIGTATFFYFTRPVVVDDTAKAVDTTLAVDESKGARAYEISSNDSKVNFTITEELRSSPFTVVGTTNDIQGTLVLGTNEDGTSSIAIGPIAVDVRTIKTDNPQRDGAINHLIVQTGTVGHEYALLSDAHAEGYPAQLPLATPFTFIVRGNLMIGGVKQPAVFSVTATKSEDVFSATLSTELKRSDYNLVIPSIPFVANVSDTFTIDAVLKAIAQ